MSVDDLGPVAALLGDDLEKEDILLRHPRTSVNLGIKTIVPALPALISISCLDHLRDLAPTGAVNVKGLAKPLVFLSGPGSFADVVGYVVVPPFSAVLVVSSGEVGGDFAPVNGSVGRCFFCHGFSKQPILLWCPNLPRLGLGLRAGRDTARRVHEELGYARHDDDMVI